MMKQISYALAMLLLFGCSLKNTNQDAENRTHQLLDEFSRLAESHRGPVPYSAWYGTEGPVLVIGCMMHGDEVGCLPPIIDRMKELRNGAHPVDYQLSLFIGNPHAGKVGKRYVDQDLNRSFYSGKDVKVNSERARALELKPYLSQADVFVDLHQTIGPTRNAFYMFPYDKNSINLARRLGGSDFLLTRPADEAFVPGRLSSTEFVRKHGGIALTFEASQKGFSSEGIERSRMVLEEAIHLFGHRPIRKQNPADLEWLEETANKRPKLSTLWRVHAENFENPAQGLHEGFKNLDPVKKGQHLGWNKNNEPMLAPRSGLIVFPKYPPRDGKGLAIGDLPGHIYLLFAEK